MTQRATCRICKGGNPDTPEKVGTEFITGNGKYARDAVQFVLDLKYPPTKLFLCRRHASVCRIIADNLQILFEDSDRAPKNKKGTPQQVFIMDTFKVRVKESGLVPGTKRTLTTMEGTSPQTQPSNARPWRGW
jgi:hypothetical protein